MRGQTLAERLSGGPLPVAAALGYAAQIGRELRTLHSAGGVHGQVEAVKIQVGPGGASLAPGESAAGQDARRDVRGWGAVLYEMLTGEHIPADAPLCMPVPEGPRTGADSLLPASKRLALKCLGVPPGKPVTMAQAYSEVRVLALLARQYQVEASLAGPGATAGSDRHRGPAWWGEDPAGEIRTPRRPAGLAVASCPKCRSTSLVSSHPRTLIERMLVGWGSSLKRCDHCNHRWITVGGVRFSRTLPKSGHDTEPEPHG